jgi:hypothetical protein
MPAMQLNARLLQRMSDKTGKSVQYIREQVSKKARRQDIPSTAAQLIWAKQLGIGVTSALARAAPEVRQEVRSVGAPRPERAPAPHPAPQKHRKSDAINDQTIRALIRDQQLYGRCKDLFRAKQHFDRVIREATTVLDDRLKIRTGIQNLSPENLVNMAINADPHKAVIEVSSSGAEQAGFHSICRGIMLAFRNKAHHSLSDAFTREDALKFCGFLDTLLSMIDKSTIHQDRVKAGHA